MLVVKKLIARILGRLANNYFESTGKKNVSAATLTTICTATVPTAGTWLVLSDVWETVNGSAGNKMIQNRVKVGSDDWATSSGAAIGRMTHVPYFRVFTATGSTTITQSTYFPTGSATEIQGYLYIVKIK